MANREITQRYKQSILGYAWVILNPLFQLVVISFVFSSILKIPSLGVPYIIFLSVALLPWNLFSTSLTSSVNILVNNSNLITKIYFPREILVYATMIAKAVDFFYSTLVLIVFFLIYRTNISLTILWLPIIFAIQIIFMAGLSLILSAFNLFYRDIQYLLSLILMLWMYLTPVMYPVEIIPEKFRFIFSLNPMAVIVNAYREVIIGKGEPNLGSLSLAFLMSVTIFLIGFYIFKKLEGQFADYV
ncbi:MAG: ABC transporter permease [Cyanobacteria bacterium]|nr:ABC transporter permease [Cyanobacteriota bacterium]